MAAVNETNGTAPYDGSGINPNDGSTYDLNPNGWNGTTYTKPPPGQKWDPGTASFVANNPFSSTSSAQDLMSQLNQAGAAPGSAQAAALTKEYTDALGTSGNALPTAGYSVGQYDPTRSKIYLSGSDLKYDNGQWGDHPWGPDQPASTSSGSGSNGLGLAIGNIGSLIQSMITSPSANINTAPSTNLIGGPAGQTQSLLDTLKGRANQSLSIDPTTDPIIRNQVDNYGANQTRAARNMTNEMAESSNPYQTGAATAAGVQANEKAAQNTSDLQASLVANELQNRRSEIQNALSESGSMLSQQDQLALQDELGKINAQIQNRQVNASLGLGLGQLALGQEGLDSNNDQFATNYGLNATNQANYWDMIKSGAK